MCCPCVCLYGCWGLFDCCFGRSLNLPDVGTRSLITIDCCGGQDPPEHLVYRPIPRMVCIKFCKMGPFQRKTHPMSQIFWISPQTQHHCVQHPIHHPMSQASPCWQRCCQSYIIWQCNSFFGGCTCALVEE